MASRLVKGQRVTIYQRWITRENEEGKATLRRFLGSTLGHGERWKVRFDGDDSDVERCILTAGLEEFESAGGPDEPSYDFVSMHCERCGGPTCGGVCGGYGEG